MKVDYICICREENELIFISHFYLLSANLNSTLQSLKINSADSTKRVVFWGGRERRDKKEECYEWHSNHGSLDSVTRQLILWKTITLSLLM